MANSYGPGVSRTLEALQRQFQNVIFQKGKPPLDSEFNLQDDIHSENIRSLVRAHMHSGFLLDPTMALTDYVTDPSWSNFFKLGRQATGEEDPIVWANVGGWLIPVVGTRVTSDSDTSNMVKLFPPPATDSRIDFVFLEVWKAQVAPNPSTTNKPSASTLWKWGNVEYGGTNITDDIEDPTIGFETTERVQVQYRIRVFGSGEGLGASVALDEFPDGLDDPNILGQGTADNPISGMTFTNMREVLGDPSLWRAGDGDPSNDLNTVDGYTYAIPISAVFRRNSNAFVAVEDAGNANQNGSFDRTPSTVTLSDPREGAKVLSAPTLRNSIGSTTTGVVQVDNLINSGFDDTSHTLSNVFMVIDDEVIGISDFDVTSSPATITIPTGGRGRNATMAVPHVASSAVKFFNTRPDGAFADEILGTDILDLRRGVNFGDWDYQRILIHNLSQLVQGGLRSSYKQSATGDTEGTLVVEVDFLHADGSTSVPNQTEALDGPDGIRTVFSDASSVQPDVTVMCDQNAPQTSGSVTSFDATVEWEVGADFKPGGFMTSASGFANGSTIFLHIGGDSGTEGARATFRDGNTRAVRFIGPEEYWKTDDPDASTGRQHPFLLRFINEASMVAPAPGEPLAEHPGPQYPLKSIDFEAPFIVLGGILHTDLQVGGVSLYNDSPGAGEYEIRLPGLNFDTAGEWYPTGDLTSLDTNGVNKTVLRGQRTLFDMLTRGGKDKTGRSSEIYLILFGDDSNPANNGAFQVTGAGTVGYTDKNASASDRVRVRFLTAGVTSFTLPTTASITAELRSQTINSEDGTGFASGRAAVAVTLTDIEGTTNGSENPWNSANLGSLAITSPVDSKLVISSMLQYHPGRGGTARVADKINRVAVKGAGSEYLRQAPASIDTTFPSSTGMPDDETYFNSTHVSVWNRIRGLGLPAGEAPNFGGDVVAFSEQDRESEVFVDRGSKTLVFRPFLDRSMTLHSVTSTATDVLLGGTGVYPGPNPPASTPKDGAGIWTTGLKMGFEVPAEFMPRFGRQDIPYHNDQTGGTGTFLSGINHLFTDSTDETVPQFSIVGGQDNTSGGNLVESLFIQTGSTSGLDYGEYGTITGPGTPAYQGRLMVDTEVISSDLGRGMEGIELPPHLGIARLYGVYDRRNFVDKGGATFDADRITPSAGGATNLLLTNQDKQTIFIRKGGASDVTGSTSDHTFVIPSNAIDISLSPDFVDGEVFSDLEYVVECVVYGFARGFIDNNNIVLARRHDGQGNIQTDGSAIELEAAHMTIPAPSPLNDKVYVAYDRTVYQGDPYMTRAGSARTVSDYEHRYGQVSITDSFELATPIQQFDSNGDIIVETPNARSLQVLAVLDFWTTLGTGKVGGELFEGTILDVGYTQNTSSASHRVPSSSTDPSWRVLTRAFSESQRDNTNHARIGLSIINNGAMTGEFLTITRVDGVAVVLTEGVDFVAGGSAAATATAIAAAVNANVSLNRTVKAIADGSDTISFESVVVGAEGNNISIGISSVSAMALRTDRPDDAVGNVTKANLAGGVDIVVNAGDGTSQLDLTGLTERLPLGILLQDSDFLCENVLNDDASAFVTSASGIRTVQTLLPLTRGGGEEYTRLIGGEGQWIGLSDGGILKYTAYNDTTAPTGSKKFRLFRGGGASFVLSNPNPGGPVDWVSGSLPSSSSPVLKGGLLICKALLVRNFPEEAFSTSEMTTHGDEIQMVVVTRGILGDGTTQVNGVSLSGRISPTGYGEGYAAADRYRLEGKPMVSGPVRSPPDPDAVDLAVFPFDITSEF